MDTVTKPLHPSVPLPKGIIATVAWKEPLLSIDVFILSAYNASNNVVYNSVTNKNSEFDPYVTIHWAAPKWGSRARNKELIASYSVMLDVSSGCFMFMLVQWYIYMQQAFIWFIIYGTKQYKEFWNP
jgi:hypothetical protein